MQLKKKWEVRLMDKKLWQKPEMKSLNEYHDEDKRNTLTLALMLPLLLLKKKCKSLSLACAPQIWNPSWPQSRVCQAHQVPQRTIRCTHKAKTLS